MVLFCATNAQMQGLHSQPCIIAICMHAPQAGVSNARVVPAVLIHRCQRVVPGAEPFWLLRG